MEFREESLVMNSKHNSNKLETFIKVDDIKEEPCARVETDVFESEKRTRQIVTEDTTLASNNRPTTAVPLFQLLRTTPKDRRQPSLFFLHNRTGALIRGLSVTGQNEYLNCNPGPKNSDHVKQLAVSKTTSQLTNPSCDDTHNTLTSQQNMQRHSSEANAPPTSTNGQINNFPNVYPENPFSTSVTENTLNHRVGPNSFLLLSAAYEEREATSTSCNNAERNNSSSPTVTSCKTDKTPCHSVKPNNNITKVASDKTEHTPLQQNHRSKIPLILSHRASLISQGKHASLRAAGSSSPSRVINGTRDLIRKSHADTRRNKDEKIKRPMNSFMIWARDFRPQLASMYSTATNSKISVLLGKIWNDLPEDEKRPYYRQAEALRRQHRHDHPGYKFQPKTSQRNGKSSAFANTALWNRFMSTSSVSTSSHSASDHTMVAPVKDIKPDKTVANPAVTCGRSFGPIHYQLLLPKSEETNTRHGRPPTRSIRTEVNELSNSLKHRLDNHLAGFNRNVSNTARLNISPPDATNVQNTAGALLSPKTAPSNCALGNVKHEDPWFQFRNHQDDMVTAEDCKHHLTSGAFAFNDCNITQDFRDQLEQSILGASFAIDEESLVNPFKAATCTRSSAMVNCEDVAGDCIPVEGSGIWWSSFIADTESMNTSKRIKNE